MSPLAPTRTPGGQMMLTAIPKESGRRTQGHWPALPKVMASGVAKVLFSHTRIKGSWLKGPEEGLFLSLTGCFCMWMEFGVGHLHTGVSQCVVTSLLSNLYPDLSRPLWIIAKITSRGRKLWERISGCLLKNSKNVEMLSRIGLPTSPAHHNSSSPEVLTNNLSQHWQELKCVGDEINKYFKNQITMQNRRQRIYCMR